MPATGRFRLGAPCPTPLLQAQEGGFRPHLPRPAKPLPPHLAALRDKLRLQHGTTAAGVLPFGDAAIDRCLPGGGLPLGQLHETLASGCELQTGTIAAGFVAGLLARLSPNRAVLWIARRHDLHAPGLLPFGLDPARLVFVRPDDDAGVLAAMETALREGGVAAVVGEIGEKFDRVASRRVQFACLRHGVTGFVLRRHPYGRAAAEAREATAVATRWRIAAAPSRGDLPREPGPPRWRLALTHTRGGRPGAWLVEPFFQLDPDDNEDDGLPTNPLRVVAELAGDTADPGRMRRTG